MADFCKRRECERDCARESRDVARERVSSRPQMREVGCRLGNQESSRMWMFDMMPGGRRRVMLGDTEVFGCVGGRTVVEGKAGRRRDNALLRCTDSNKGICYLCVRV